jgi:transglutaminase-like putative cysteine protease
MSLWRDELKASNATIACLVVLGLVAVGSLSRVIAWPGYAAWAIAALAIGATFAGGFGQRSLGLGFGLLVLAAGATLPALFLRGEDASLLPTPSAFSNVRELIGEGLGAIPKVTPPVEAQPRFLILIWLSLLLLGFLSAAWVVVRRPVGAVISTLATVTFAGSVGDGQGRTWFAAAAVAATGAFFLAEGRHRIALWGGGRIAIPGWLGLPTLAAACGVAIVTPIIIGSTPLVKVPSAIRPRIVIIKPLSDIKRQLKVDPPLEVMRVTSSSPQYWRLTGLDAYDGREWVLEARAKDVPESGLIAAADPPATGKVVDQTYRLTSLLAPWMPAVYAASSVSTPEGVRVDEKSQTLLLREEVSEGLVYSVQSRIPVVKANISADPLDVEDPTERDFGAKAASIVEGARTPLDRARRLEVHFRKYAYDEDVDGGHTVARLEQFLADKRGYCEQFAATMTLMLRGLGIDARVGVGFLPGAARAGEYIVSTRDAHAWVEAKIPGAGWFAFDPTPTRSDASTVPPEAEEAPPEPEEVPQVTSVPAPTPATEELPDEVVDEPLVSRVPVAVWWSLLAAAALALFPTMKAVRRSRRRRGVPDESVVGAYNDLIDGARDLGWRPSLMETQREFVTRTLGSDESAQRLAMLAARALYASGRNVRADVDVAWSDRKSALTVLKKRSSWWRRAIAPLDPRTFLPERRWLDRPLRRARTRVATALGRA